MPANIAHMLIININASPYHAGKIHDREKVLKDREKEGQAHIVYVNMVGGQDELVFDGASVAVDRRGKVVCRAQRFEEDLMIVEIARGRGGAPPWDY